ncbi:Malto-oligosyltrehalose trehalohydrolase [Rubellimicrobium mesophilum DSM 19309]|uniref:Malto-oligosyltrehalose trehalohydrolase n=1 Tax=Rubellimicrobium mesophilum DSM 19309 TaxID=442562 RepID=A0A017HKR8_9RHOB|nr:malto-oligosyltrehalose trehalohydrolase [Rubellimicrobium mesophilum]EYD74768.1 Malto-oligosyltrehalose trehalohydrolase [Rubellimicrobium mesophilum DSM 19309]
MRPGSPERTERRHPVGAEPLASGVHFRVWAPDHKEVTLVTPDGPDRPMEAEDGGFFALFVPGLEVDSLYRFRLSGDKTIRPDPASRFQPDGPDGWSQVVDPGEFAWTDEGWAGLTLPGQAFYEMHIGTFTEEGTWAAAARELPRLRELGITAVEIMPVADFSGRFGWGYDGVCPFAPTRLYGTPDDMRRFVDAAHALGLGVILDVVFNHLGTEGNHIPAFGKAFVSERHMTDWGAELNFDGPGSEAVRAFVLANVAHWIEEYHVDGFRVDATQNITDESPTHILAEITRTARAAAGAKPILIVGENEPQDTRLVRPLDRGGHGMDAVWADDIHHSAFVALTGRGGAYMSDYSGGPQELISAFRRGYLFQGQGYSWHDTGRGTPGLDLGSHRFVAYLENHDQIANTGPGLRLHQRTSPGRFRAMTALLCLAPTTPMLFQGQETGSERPFTYFLDSSPALREEVRQGRIESMGQFKGLASPEMRDRLPDPADETVFRACKLRPPATERERQVEALHRDLLRLRREDPAIRPREGTVTEGAVIGPEAFLLRFFGSEGPGGGDDRLLLVNLGPDLRLRSLAEPLVAPTAKGPWTVLWSSEHPDYGGLGTPPVIEKNLTLFLPGHAAVLLAPSSAKRP